MLDANGQEIGDSLTASRTPIGGLFGGLRTSSGWTPNTSASYLKQLAPNLTDEQLKQAQQAAYDYYSGTSMGKTSEELLRNPALLAEQANYGNSNLLGQPLIHAGSGDEYMGWNSQNQALAALDQAAKLGLIDPATYDKTAALNLLQSSTAADAKALEETAAERARNDSGFGGTLAGGGLKGALAWAGLAGSLYGLGGMMGGAGGLGGAGAAAGAADASAGLLPQFGSNAAYASGLGGSLGATGAGSGAMDFTDVLSDFVSGGTEYAPQNVVDLFNNAGMPGYSNYGQSLEELAAQLFDNAGMPGYTQTGDPATGLDWLKSQFGGPNSLLNSIKSLGGTGASAGSGTGQSNNSLLGTALGGLLGSMNGAKQAGTTTVTQEPWAGQQPYLLDAFKKAQTAAGGSPLQTQANTNYSSVLSGPTTNPMLGMDNPYLTSAINNANADVTRAFMPAVNQANRASGSFGNSGVADTYGKNMADAYSRNSTSMRMQDYTNQQNLQQQAVNNTLGFTQNANTYAAQPSQNYANTVGGQNFGMARSEPYFNNPINGIMGGAMVGNSIGSNLGF